MTTATPPQNPITAGTQVPSQTQGHTEAGLKERFFRYFQHEVTALQQQMERLNTTSPSGGERSDAVEHCLAGIERLSQEVKDSASYLPAYDLRTYGEAIKALSFKLQSIRAQFAPPKKFQFKTARKNPSAISLSDAAELAQQKSLRIPGGAGYDSSNANSSFVTTPLDNLSPTEEKREREAQLQLQQDQTQAEPSSSVEQDVPQTDIDNDDTNDPTKALRNSIRTLSFSTSRSITISSHTNTHILLPASASHATSSGSVTNLRHCVVDLSPPTNSTSGAPFATLTLKNIKDSLVVCGRVTGPAHITAVENSMIVAACGQFRMHGSKNVDVYLHCGSRPIIEDCVGVRFAKLPTAYMTDDLSAIPNCFDQIDDFKWLKAEPSPNFRILEEEERVGESVWRDVVPGGHSVGLEDVLRAVKGEK